MKSGVDEIEMVPGDSSAIDAEIKALEETQKNTDWGDSSDPTPEYIALDKEIRAKLDEKNNIPDVEFDNTVYWEGYYGGCKRTSYNTQGGVHKLGGTPFRKNYAGVGYIYDPVRDAFYTEQPYASWTLDESTCYWQAANTYARRIELVLEGRHNRVGGLCIYKPRLTINHILAGYGTQQMADGVLQ